MHCSQCVHVLIGLQGVPISCPQTEIDHGYDVVGPPVRHGTPPTQEPARERAISDPMYETVQASASVDINTRTNVRYRVTGIEGFSPSTPNEREFENPLYGDDGGLSNIRREFDNPTYVENDNGLTNVHKECDNPTYGEQEETQLFHNPIYGEGEVHVADNPIYEEGEFHVSDNLIHGQDDSARLELKHVAV